jgi:hypothetical protein
LAGHAHDATRRQPGQQPEFLHEAIQRCAEQLLWRGLRLVENQEAEAKARIKALRDAARVGIADIEAERYRTFSLAF